MNSIPSKSTFICPQELDKVPPRFRWPESDLVPAIGELDAPIIDLKGFFNGDETSIKQGVKLINRACLSHGFFQVINHGVDDNLIESAFKFSDNFFKLPTEEKLKGLKTLDDPSGGGYTGAHSERFPSKLPWKEILYLTFHENSSNPSVVETFKSKFGKEYEPQGVIFQKYCEAMKKLALSIMELLAISLEVDRSYYREFFEDAGAIMTCIYYASCPEPESALGVGPHRDPVSLTLLVQDEVGGLQVFADNKWQNISPHPGAIVINLGDTFVALSNGKYESCLHRVGLNKEKERKSFAYFLNPNPEKIVRAPEELVVKDGVRRYPDFTWSQFYHYTQTVCRSDPDNLPNFIKWLRSSQPEDVDDAVDDLN